MSIPIPEAPMQAFRNSVKDVIQDFKTIGCKPSNIMIATLSTCAQLERDNISFRLQSGRKRYIEKGGKLGRKVGSVKTEEQMKAEYREVISLLRKGYSIRDVAKLSGRGVSTVQRVKRLIKVQSSQ